MHYFKTTFVALTFLSLLGIGVFTAGTQLAKAESSVGCGLGQVIAPKQSLVSSTTRFITNSIYCNQLFAMSTGTSGCTQHSIVKEESAPMYYAEANIENLKVEMAQGEGEFLVGFSQSLGCKDQVIGTFNQTTQKEYGKIFKSGKESPTQMLENVKKVVNENKELKGQCSYALI